MITSTGLKVLTMTTAKLTRTNIDNHNINILVITRIEAINIAIIAMALATSIGAAAPRR